jgi:polysaccharide pyruvyl transferase WcaK-like protein
MLKLILGRDKFSAYSRYQRADIVVWNGRNFRGNEGALAEFVKIFELCANPLLCSFMHKPIYCVGASVWPLRGRLAKYILRITFNRCQKVWLREKSSLSNTQLLGSKLHTDNLSLLPDLSFYMLNKYVETILSNPQHREVKQNMVSLTLVGRKEISSDVAYFNYIDQVAEAINFLHKQGKIVQVVPQVTYSLEPFHTELELIVNKLSTSENLLILDKVSRLEQLVEIYNQSSLLIASRMHSAIFAASCGTPVIALSYDSGGKWSILRELNIQEDCILDISTLRPGHLVRALQAKLNITPRNNKNIIQLYADQISHELSSVTTIK